MVLSPISASEIYSVINNFKPIILRDDISMKMIQYISSSIINLLMYIINKSFDDRIFPSLFKRYKIIPIFKSGDCNDFNNYRPIYFFKNCRKLLINRQIHFILLVVNNLVLERI